VHGLYSAETAEAGFRQRHCLIFIKKCIPVVLIAEQGLHQTHGTVRTAAKHFGISKSTVHKDLSQRLPHYNHTLYLQVRTVLEENKAQRHIRGGLATRRKYLLQKED